MSASKDRKIVEMHAEIERLRAALDAALDVVIDLGGEVREPEMDEARRMRADAERYCKLVATGKYCAASIGGGWGLSCGNSGRDAKAELDAAADALPAIDAARKGEA